MNFSFSKTLPFMLLTVLIGSKIANAKEQDTFEVTHAKQLKLLAEHGLRLRDFAYGSVSITRSGIETSTLLEALEDPEILKLVVEKDIVNFDMSAAKSSYTPMNLKFEYRAPTFSFLAPFQPRDSNEMKHADLEDAKKLLAKLPKASLPTLNMRKLNMLSAKFYLKTGIAFVFESPTKPIEIIWQLGAVEHSLKAIEALDYNIDPNIKEIDIYVEPQYMNTHPNGLDLNGSGEYASGKGILHLTIAMQRPAKSLLALDKNLKRIYQSAPKFVPAKY